MSLYLSCHVSLLLLFVVYFITRTTQNEQKHRRVELKSDRVEHESASNCDNREGAEISSIPVVSLVSKVITRRFSFFGCWREKSFVRHWFINRLLALTTLERRQEWGDHREMRNIFSFVVARWNFSLIFSWHFFLLPLVQKKKTKFNAKQCKTCVQGGDENPLLLNALDLVSERMFVLYVSMYIPKSSSRHTSHPQLELLE